MFKPKLQLKTVTDGSVKAAKNFRDLSKLAVYVGIPESKAARQKPGITNAAILFFNTHGVRTIDARRIMKAMQINRGISYKAARDLFVQSRGSMAYHITPRPVIEPAIEAQDNQEAIVRELKKCATDQLAGNHNGAVNALKRAGMEGQNRSRAWFDDPRNHWAPNAPSTVRRKKSSHPLVDTSQMKKSITFVVSED